MALVPALAVTLPQFRSGPDASLRALEDSYQLGYAGGFLFDHLWPLGQPHRPALECWTLLAALAGHLSALAPAAGPGGAGPGGGGPGGGGPGGAGPGGAGPGGAGPGGAGPGGGGPGGAGPGGGGPARPGGFRLGTLVTRAGLRPPALLAHMARTVGMAAGAPPIVGIGMGDAGNRAENEAFGIPYHTDPTRRAAELLGAIDALRGPLAARPGPGPEIWVGGTSRRAHGLAGRVADAWNGWGLDPDELAAGLAEARRSAEEAGRDPEAVGGTWGGQVLVADDQEAARGILERWGAGRSPAEVGRTVAGDGPSVARRLAELADAGASWCVLAFVGGSAAEMRSLLAKACELPVRQGAEGYDR